MVTLSVCMYNN